MGAGDEIVSAGRGRAIDEVWASRWDVGEDGGWKKHTYCMRTVSVELQGEIQDFTFRVRACYSSSRELCRATPNVVIESVNGRAILMTLLARRQRGSASGRNRKVTNERRGRPFQQEGEVAVMSFGVSRRRHSNSADR